MPRHLSAEAAAQYERDGFYFPIQVISAAEARAIRSDVEAAERHLAAQGEGLRHRPHLLVTALDRLIRNETVLDAVEDLLGPNLLCWTSLFFTKDAHDPAFVSMHQDSTYWGLSSVEGGDRLDCAFAQHRGIGRHAVRARHPQARPDRPPRHLSRSTTCSRVARSWSTKWTKTRPSMSCCNQAKPRCTTCA